MRFDRTKEVLGMLAIIACGLVIGTVYVLAAVRIMDRFGELAGLVAILVPPVAIALVCAVAADFRDGRRL